MYCFEREARLPDQPCWVSTNCTNAYFYGRVLSTQHSLREIDDSLLYSSTDSDKEKTLDPLSLVVVKGCDSGGQCLTDDPLSLMAAEWCGSGGQHADHVQKIPPSLPSLHQRSIIGPSLPSLHQRSIIEPWKKSP
jgi:hypothetical protein